MGAKTEMNCENCGARIYALGCVNCNEDSYIFHDQIVPMDLAVSGEFVSKVSDQQKEWRKKTDENGNHLYKLLKRERGMKKGVLNNGAI